MSRNYDLSQGQSRVLKPFLSHRFQKQTNLQTPKVKGGKVASMKCAVCDSSIAFGRSASVCKGTLT